MPAEKLIDSFVNREKFKDDKDFAVKQLDEIYKTFQRIRTINIQLGKSSSFKEVADGIRAVKKEEDELLKLQYQLDAAYQKRMLLETQQAKLLAEEKELIRQRNAELKNQVKEENAAEGSIEKLRASVIRLNKEYDNLSKAERDGTKGQGLKKSIASTVDELKKLEGETGRFQRNVGNYANSFSGATDVLKQDLQEIKQQLSTMADGDNGFEQLSKQEQLLEQLLEGLNVTFSSTKQEFRTLQETAKKLGLELGVQNETFQKFVGEVGSAKDSLEDLQGVIKQQSSDTKSFDGLVASAQALAGAYGVAQGAAALFGSDNEQLQKTFVKLQAAMTVLQGLQAIQNALQKESAAYQFVMTVRTYALAAAQKIYAVATVGATFATTALRAALIATGLGALLILLTSFVGKVQDWASSTDDTREAQKGLNEALAETVKLQKDLDDARNRSAKMAIEQLERETELRKAAGVNAIQGLALDKQVADAKSKFAQQEIADKNITAEGIGKLNQAYLNATDVLANAEQKKIGYLYASNKQKKKIDEDEIKGYDKLIDAAKSNADKYKGVLDYQTDIYKQAQDAKQQQDKIATDTAKLNAEDQRKLVLESARIQSELILAKNSIILNDEKSTLEQRLTALQSNAKAQRRIIEAEKNDVLNNPSASGADRTIAIKKAASEEEKITISTKEAIEKVRDDFRKRDLRAATELFKVQLENQIKFDEDLIANENLSLDTRLIAFRRNYSNKEAIINAEYQLRKQTEVLNDKELELLEADHQAKIVALQAEGSAKVVEINQQEVDKLKNARESLIGFERQQANDINALRSADAAKAYAKDVLSLNASLQSREISLTQYNKKRAILDAKYNEKALELEITQTKDLLALATAGTQEKYDLQKKLADAEIALSEYKANKQLETEKKLADARKQLGQEVLSFITTLVNASFENELNNIQEQINALDAKKQKDIDVASQTISNEQDKAARIKIIEAKAQAEKEQLELKQRRIKEQQARFEKAQNIAEIIGRTAVAVVTTLGDKTIQPGFLRIPLAITTGAVGLAQLAKAIATPIPKYADGTEDHPGGDAWVGDGGKRELAITPDGKAYITPNTPTLVNLPIHTRVLPDVDAIMKMLPFLAGPKLANFDGEIMNHYELIGEMKKINNRLGSVENAIKNKKENHFTVTRWGMLSQQQQDNNFLDYLNENLQH